MSQESYFSYQNMLATVTMGIEELGGICKELSLKEQEESLVQVKDRLQNHIFSVGIMGELKRGKSTVINALLGQEIVPSHICPCTAALTRIRWGADKRAEIYFKDGHVQTVTVGDLDKYVTNTTAESKEKAATVDYAVVHYPWQLCQNGVQIVDTPGLNYDSQMDAITQNVLPALDAIIMVLSAHSPFSKSEAEFVRNKVMPSDLGRIIFVVNMIDTIAANDVEWVLAQFKARIRNSVLEKMEEVYGKDSEDYINAQSKLCQIRLLPVSARNALKGKLKNDRRKYEESGYPEFEETLCKLLTEEHGRQEMFYPVNKLRSVSEEAVRAIDMRLNAMQMEADDFRKVQKQSFDTVRENRRKKKEKLKAFWAMGKTLYSDLLSEEDCAYDCILNNTRRYVQQVPVDPRSIDKIAPQINQRIQDDLSLQAERMLASIQRQFDRDVIALESFGQAMAADMRAIQTNFAPRSVHTATSGGYSTGGLLALRQKHSFKGALRSFFDCVISVTVPILPNDLCRVVVLDKLIEAWIPPFGGKAAMKLYFTPEYIRSRLLSAVDNAVKKLMDERVLEDWLKDACIEYYEKAAEGIDWELEITLCTMERTLADLTRNREDSAWAENRMQKQRWDILRILDSLEPVWKKLNEGL